MAGFEPTRQQRKAFSEWLGIPSAECPPNHYRLLGLAVFEADNERIKQAAEQRLRQIAPLQLGEDARIAEALMRRIRQVAEVLLNAENKSQYDRSLREHLNAAPSAPQPDPSPSQVRG